MKGVFADPKKAKAMTLEQLLSHTSGLEEDDDPQGGRYGEDPNVKQSTLHERFIYQGTLEHRYKHECEPGEGRGIYSNIGYDVVAWMIELAYNKREGHQPPVIPYSQIIRDELFTDVFKLSEDTCISPGPSGQGDVIQAGCGDMVSTVEDLLRVAKVLRGGEKALESHFGDGWQERMLTPRDSEGKFGLGCEGGASSIQFSGLNYEIFEDGTEDDITAHVAFPRHENQPGIVVMCDSNALGPESNQVKFCNELRKLAGLPDK